MRIAFIAALVIALASPAMAMVTGNQLMQMCSGGTPYKRDHACSFYILGLTEGLWDHDVQKCIPGNATGSQVAEVVVKYLNDHPEDLHNSAAAIFIIAVTDGFRCW